MATNQTLALGGIVLGGVLLYSGFKGQNVLDVFQGIEGEPHPNPFQDLLDRIGAGGGGGGVPGTSGGYSWIFPKGTHYSPGRTDMGVDIESVKVGTPILAIGDGHIQHIQAMGAFGPTWMSYKLTGGPQAGKSVFIGHSGPPIVKSGSVKAGQPIIKVKGYGASPGHLEIGWANSAGTNTLASPHYHEGDNTAEGRSFRKFLNTLNPPKKL